MTATSAISSSRISDTAGLNDLCTQLLQYAILAPSEHNSQPWLFRIRDDSLELIADRTRGLPVVDPHDRALTISCGVALDHLVLAARNMGREVLVELCPDRDDIDLLARLRLRGRATPSAAEEAMFAAIAKRRTTRTLFDNRTLPENIGDRCVELSKQFGIELILVTDRAQRASIAKLVVRADRMQLSSLRFRRELASWVHSGRGRTRDGMSRPGIDMPDVLSPHGTLAIRTFDLGDGNAASDGEAICEGSPTMALFTSPAERVEDWLATGRALSRVFLTLTAAGATASFLNPPIEIRELRPRVRTIVHCRGVPQLLMRFGYGPTVAPTTRRNVADFLIA